MYPPWAFQHYNSTTTWRVQVTRKGDISLTITASSQCAKEVAHTSFMRRLCSGSPVVSWVTPKPLECGDPEKMAVLTASSRMRQFPWPRSDPIRLLHLFLLNHERTLKHFSVAKDNTNSITSSCLVTVVRQFMYVAVLYVECTPFCSSLSCILNIPISKQHETNTDCGRFTHLSDSLVLSKWAK